MSNINRRDLMIAAASVAACYLCTNDGVAFAADSAPPATVDAGLLASYDKDGLFDQYAKDAKVLVYRENGKIYASTAACTHRKVLLKVVDGQARCPAHGSRFDADGKPLRGPATKPLVRYAVSVNADKHLVIDTTKTFDEAQWADPAASVAAA